MLIAIIFACFSLLQADEEMTIETKEANYNGKALFLQGDVSVEHELGRLAAQEMVLTPPTGDKKLRLGTLDMQKKVRMQLHEGGQLSCTKARLDYQTLQGNFEGDGEEEFVVYMESCRDKSSNQRVPIVVKSRFMTVQIDRRAKEKASSRSYISAIDAEKEVTVDYNHSIIASSDYGHYCRIGVDGDQKENALAGVIVLSSSGPEKLCQVTNRNGDLITSRHIAIDTIKRQIHFSNPKGTLSATQESNSPDRLDFSSDTLEWDDSKGIMILREHVALQQKSFGRLTTDNELRLIQDKDKKELKEIESNGKTCLKRNNQELICYGQLHVDHVNLFVTMDSPLSENGSIEEGKQVFLDDPQGQIYADRVTLKYGLNGKVVVPEKIILEGHVRMSNSRSEKEQYALADRVDYFLETEEMIFKADEGKRVLFYDHANELQVSAPGLKITRDKTTHKETIKGIGDVRFSFVEKEFEQLREKFSLNMEKG